MSDEQSVEEEWPEPKRPGKTHWNECWKVRGHHNCAVARVRKLRERLEEAVREAIPTMRRASENTEVPDEVRRSLWSIGYRLRSALDSREDEGAKDTTGPVDEHPRVRHRYGHDMTYETTERGYGRCSCGARENTDAAVERCPHNPMSEPMPVHADEPEGDEDLLSKERLFSEEELDSFESVDEPPLGWTYAQGYSDGVRDGWKDCRSSQEEEPVIGDDGPDFDAIARKFRPLNTDEPEGGERVPADEPSAPHEWCCHCGHHHDAHQHAGPERHQCLIDRCDCDEYRKDHPFDAVEADTTPVADEEHLTSDEPEGDECGYVTCVHCGGPTEGFHRTVWIGSEPHHKSCASAVL